MLACPDLLVVRPVDRRVLRDPQVRPQRKTCEARTSRICTNNLTYTTRKYRICRPSDVTPSHQSKRLEIAQRNPRLRACFSKNCHINVMRSFNWTSRMLRRSVPEGQRGWTEVGDSEHALEGAGARPRHLLAERVGRPQPDRKSTRLNSSHSQISYA